MIDPSDSGGIAQAIVDAGSDGSTGDVSTDCCASWTAMNGRLPV